MTTTTSSLKTAETQLIKSLAYETDRYYLQIGNSVNKDSNHIPVYQLINKEHGFIEGESISLFDALSTLTGRTEAVEEMEAHLATKFPVIDGPGGGVTH